MDTPRTPTSFRLPPQTLVQLRRIAAHLGPGITPSAALVQVVQEAARRLPDPPPEATPRPRGRQRRVKAG